MAERKTKFVGPLYLASDEYARLEQAGRTQERDPLQHARWLIKQGLPGGKAAETDDRAPAGAGAAQ